MRRKKANNQPLLFVFAGPNGSGKTTVKRGLSDLPGEYINADDIKREKHVSDLEAAIEAERRRNAALDEGRPFSFETVLSTDRSLIAMKRARQSGYLVHCIYVLTCNADINVMRIKARVLGGGHAVPEEKIRTRYERALKLLPQVISACDWIAVYDNSGDTPAPIFVKDGVTAQIMPCLYWTKEQIEQLVTSDTPC